MKQPSVPGLVWLICALTLLGSQWIFLRGTASVLPLEFWDEAVYIRGTFDLPRPYPHWGPVYVYWYAALKAIFSGPIAALYANAALVTALLSWIGFFWSMRLRAHPLAALACGTLVLLWWVNFSVMPKISHFDAAIVLFAGLAATFLRGNFGSKCLLFSAALFGSVYLRQENIVLALFFFIAFAARYIWAKERPPPLVWIPSLIVALIVAYGMFVYSPFSNRSWPAFVDHYLFSAVKDNPAITRAVIENEIFGGAKSVGEAAKNNLPEFAKYVGYNYWRFFFVQFPHGLFRHYVLFPFVDKGNPFVALGEFLILLAFLLWGGYRRGSGRAALWGRVAFLNEPTFRFFVLIASALSLKSLLVVGLMEAEPRYFVGLLVAVVILIFSVLSRDFVNRSVSLAIVVCFLVLLLMPSVMSPGVRADIGSGGGQGFRGAVEFLNHELKPGERVFGQPAYTTYTPMKIDSCDFHCGFYGDKLRREFKFSRFLAAMGAGRIDWIVVDNTLLWNLSERLPGGSDRALLNKLDSTACIRRVFKNTNAKIYRVDRQCLAAANGAAARD